MKYRFLALFIAMAMTACKNQKKEEQAMPHDATHSDLSKETTTVRGEFIYLEDIAVFTTNSAIYEVIQDAKMHELLTAARQLKQDDRTMVIATLKVVVIPNPKRKTSQDVWEKAIEIKDIMEVQPVKKKQSTPLSKTT